MSYKSKFIFLLSFLIINLKALGQEDKLPIILEDNNHNSMPLVFHISGDGGWKGFDVKLAEEYKANGLSTVALNSIKYFWSTKTPDQVIKDMTPVLTKYMKAWNKKELILVGFSFGAEIMPFIYTKLPEELKQKVKLVVLVTPSKTSDFTIHIADMMSMNGTYAYDVVREVEKIKDTKVLSIFGERERSIFPNPNLQKNLKVKYVKGGHHFTDDKTVMSLILSEIQTTLD
jgi:type IV secretory pathway VirJ component